jgi:hypothetical protein
MDKYGKVLEDLEKALFLVCRGDVPYFSEHKNRYRSDLQIIENLYTRGEILEIGSLPCFLTFCLKRLGYPVISLNRISDTLD